MDGLIYTSAIDDLSYAPSAKQRLRDDRQNILIGRRNHKTLKGGREAVWPPYLEAALIEALYRYHTDLSRTIKPAGRFPMRNKFISNYILRVTGKRRHPKQVGSRLQQLRYTCRSQSLQDLLCHHSLLLDDSSDSGFSTGSSSSSSPSSLGDSIPYTAVTPPMTFSDIPVDQRYSELIPPLSPIHVPIILLHENVALPWSPLPEAMAHPGVSTVIFRQFPLPVIPIDTPNPGLLESPSYQENYSMFQPSPMAPRLIIEIDPVVIFSSSRPICVQTHHSFFAVFLGEECVYSETTRLDLFPSPSQAPETKQQHEGEDMYLYNTNLIPSYWRRICQSADPTRYIIKQKILRSSLVTCELSVWDDISTTIPLHEPTVLSVEYSFAYCPSSPSTHIDSSPSWPFIRIDQSTIPPDLPDLPIHQSSFRVATQASATKLHDRFAPAREQLYLSQTHEYCDLRPIPWSEYPPADPGDVESDRKGFTFSQRTTMIPHDSSCVSGDTFSAMNMETAIRPSLSSCFPSALSNYVL